MCHKDFFQRNNNATLELKASDNQYLNKDFHGSLCYAIKYLDGAFDHDVTLPYLRRVGSKNFNPLIDGLKKDGVIILESKNPFRFNCSYR